MVLPTSIIALWASLSVALAAPQAATSTTTGRSTSSSSSSSSSSSTSSTSTSSGGGGGAGSSRPIASSSVPATRSGLPSVSHGSYSGTPSTTGALRASSVGTGISVGGVPPAQTTYPSDGQLHDAEPAPYTPGGGVGLNTTPIYNVQSDFDYQSLVYISLFPFRECEHIRKLSF